MKRTLILTAAFGLAALAFGVLSAGAGGPSGEGDGRNEIRQGLAIAPLPLDMRGKDRALVGLGSYIVNAQGGCNDCHSVSQFAPGGDPFKGEPKHIDTLAYLRGGQSFGPFVSRNLRPEIGTNLPAGLTRAQFFTVMRTGFDFDQVHPHISPLLQVMPWPSFQNMTDQDLRAIYEYLRALPPVPPGG